MNKTFSFLKGTSCMVHRAFNFSFLILAAYALLLSSCAKDEDNPLADDRDKFTGSWTCKETPAGQTPVTFTITISKYGASDTVFAYNFNNLGSAYKAIFLISSTSVTIPSQDISGFSVTNGSGLYSNDKINLSYTVDGENYSAVCSQ